MLWFSVFIALYLVFYSILLIGYWMKMKKKDIHPTIDIREVTVLIPFRNEYENLKKLLMQIGELETRPHQFIFVNDHSEDQWNDLFPSQKSDLIQVLSLGEEDQGKKKAIYEGVKRVQTKFALCWDADVQFKPNYFEEVKNIPHGDLVILPVNLTSTSFVQSAGEVDFYLSNLVNQASAYWSRPILCNGSNLLFDKKSYLEVIRLEEHAHVLSGDDMFLLRNMERAQKSIHLYSGSSCRVSTESPRSFRKLLQQRNRWFGKSFLLRDPLLNFWAGSQFMLSLSYLVLFIYFLLVDIELGLLFFLVKTGIDLFYLAFYFVF